jgi:hypothetical protein
MTTLSVSAPFLASGLTFTASTRDRAVSRFEYFLWDLMDHLKGEADHLDDDFFSVGGGLTHRDFRGLHDLLTALDRDFNKTGAFASLGTDAGATAEFSN